MPAHSSRSAHPLLAGLRRRWLVTGAAGFIGSHLIETLLAGGQDVVSLDNLSTGYRSNLESVRAAVGEEAWRRHRFMEADIVDPQGTHAANATGFLNMLVAARDAKAARFVYAASSSTYGDHPGLPKVEDMIGRPLSPYAVTKYLNELYADVFGRCYGMASVGLRYFNVFGARQDPEGPYAAVIPRWAQAMLAGEPCVINGDGETSRDFCFVGNAVQANLRAALTDNAAALNEVYNVAVGGRTTLNELHRLLGESLLAIGAVSEVAPAIHREFRAGDVRHSQADIGKAQRLLGYAPTHDLRAGLSEAVGWYAAQFAPSAQQA